MNFRKIPRKTAGKLWDEKVQAVEDFLAENGDAFKAAYLGPEYNLENFIYEDCDIDPESVAFTKTMRLTGILSPIWDMIKRSSRASSSTNLRY